MQDSYTPSVWSIKSKVKYRILGEISKSLDKKKQRSYRYERIIFVLSIWDSKYSTQNFAATRLIHNKKLLYIHYKTTN